MNIFLVSYDLDKPGQDYPRIIERLKALGALRVLYSEWILQGNYSAVNLRDDLRQYIDQNDKLLVVALTGEVAWTSLMINNEEFKKAITQ
jgi:hypothetical protein